MKSFIEELYYGNIDPQNSGFEDNESVQRELRTISENEDWLAERLNGEEKKRFLDFADAWSAGGGDATLDGFITGFLLGRVLCWIHLFCRKLRRRTICKNKTYTNFSKGCPVELTGQPFLLLHRCEGDRHV